MQCRSRNKPSFSMVQAEWEKLIIEVKLNDMMEAVGTGVAHSKYYFINFGKKEKLNH